MYRSVKTFGFFLPNQGAQTRSEPTELRTRVTRRRSWVALAMCTASFLAYLACSESVRVFLRELARLVLRAVG